MPDTAHATLLTEIAHEPRFGGIEVSWPDTYLVVDAEFPGEVATYLLAVAHRLADLEMTWNEGEHGGRTLWDVTEKLHEDLWENATWHSVDHVEFPSVVVIDD